MVPVFGLPPSYLLICILSSYASERKDSISSRHPLPVLDNTVHPVQLRRHCPSEPGDDHNQGKRTNEKNCQPFRPMAERRHN